MKKKGRTSPAPRRPESMKAIAWRIIAFALAIWLCAMVLITYGVAVDLYRQMEYDAQRFASLYADTEHNFEGVNRDAPGYADYCRLNTMNETADMFFFIRPTLLPLIDTDEFITFDEGDLMPYSFAISYHYNEGERKIELTSASSYLYFSYMTEDQWEADVPPEIDTGYLYIDQSKLDQAYGDTDLSAHFFMDITARRLTGWFEGNEFHPVSAETADSSFSFDWSRRDRLKWQQAYQCPAPEGKELVTIYSLERPPIPGTIGDPVLSILPVTIDSTEYTQLADVLPTLDKKESLTDAVVRGYGTYQDRDNNIIHVRVALRAQPLKYALSQMICFYLVTLLLMVPAIWLILRSIRNHLVLPVAQIASRASGRPLPLPTRYKPRWKEARMLEDHYDAIAQTYYDATIEANQLRTALDYAKNAEEHRRQLISNITHELKTPLAVIHSYAEGLTEGIAADKQEQYLKVILNETERMDAMVLEMLELSRLEAGKVRLSMEQFSLLGLTRSIFDKLAPVAEERSLQIHFSMAEEFDITADEGRISQVITNFATNALKYTPEGGNIWIKVCRHEGKTMFMLENECDPLPAEALANVWNSFYRAEVSRTTSGTGLGLTIAKAIVELHGGTVHVSNTSNGVEFRFDLP